MSSGFRITAEKGAQDYSIEREFDAGPELVFRAFSEPGLLKQWLLPHATQMEVERMDCRSGGSFSHHHLGPDGKRYGFLGVYHEVIPGKRIVNTSEFTGLPMKIDPVLQITRFEALENGKTRLHIHTICPSADYRDNMMAANMEASLRAGYVALDQLLATQKKRDI